MKHLIFSFFLFIFAFITKAQAPQGYYSSAEGKTGTALRAALHSIIKDHNSVPYKELHSYYPQTDAKPNGKVWDMYSDVPGGHPAYEYNFGKTCGNYSGEGDCYNREHLWPQSWFNDGAPMKSDLFHVVPTDGYVNGRRSNYAFGEVRNADWTSTNGSKLGNNTYSGFSGTCFEPIDEYKGDIARTMFYMSTRYYNEDGSWKSSDMTTKANLKPWAIKMLLEWHHNDPVSQKEIDRNNAVYDIQYNRNPFIDNPDFADMIWDEHWGYEDFDEEIQIAVYPNPATSYVRIDGSNIQNITIYDIVGHTILTQQNDFQTTISINLENLSKGLYLISIIEKNGKVSTEQLIVNK